MGEKHGPSDYYYESGSKKFEAYFFLGVQDSFLKHITPMANWQKKAASKVSLILF